MTIQQNLRLGVIGTGPKAVEYAQSWISMPEVTFVAVSDDVVCAVTGRLASGALLTLHATGDGPSGCASNIMLFYTRAIIRIDAWGAWREIAAARIPGSHEEAEIMDNPLQSFLAIRAGNAENLSNVEAGLRFARLWDAIKASSARDGEPVSVDLGASTPRL
jgi:predicted dehydrogenase